MNERKRYAIVGTGGRSRMFIDAILGRFAEHAELVGLCDVSATRMAHWNRHIAERFSAEPVPTYDPERFEAMLAERRVDVVIVTTVDAYHHEYIIRALEAGCDAVTEKPMTIDEVKAAAIFEAIQRTGRSLRVTFNYRYQPAVSKLREVVAAGQIGTPLHVDFQWYLDTSHGADYFRRWHREMDKSGGLLVHKATHHFDMVNFILDDLPEEVFAYGQLKFYGRANAEARGERYAYERYTGNVTPDEDPFAMDLSQGTMKSLYLDAEQDSGYVRDRNVFGDDPPVDIYDTHCVVARYRGGPLMNYSLIAYSPWEGERVTITGTRGQVEYFSRGKGHIIQGQSDEDLAAQQYTGERHIRLQPMFEASREVEIPEASGGHGGGDARILERIFLPDPPPDPLRRDASHIDGAASILTGIAANRSIRTGQPVRLDDLLPGALSAAGRAEAVTQGQGQVSAHR